MALKAEELQAKQELKQRQVRESLQMGIWARRLPPINNDDPEQVRARIELYLDKCAERGFIPGLEGLCLALHITRTTFKSWVEGRARKGQEHQKICMDANQFILSFMEHAILDGIVPPVPAIFTMTNQFDGYVQKQTISQEVTTNILDTATPEQLEKRYGDGMIIDAIYEEKEAENKQIESVSKKSKVQKAQKAHSKKKVAEGQKK